MLDCEVYSEMLYLTPSPLGQLPDPVRCQTHLRELSVMAEDDRLRQHLLEALQLTSPSEDIIKSKVSVHLLCVCAREICR